LANPSARCFSGHFMASFYPRPPADLLSSHEVGQYRPVSLLAVTGLLIGVASVVAFIAPLLWVVPLLGFCLSAAGLWRINHSDPPLSGRKAAVVGLMLATLFGVAAPTRSLGRNWVLTQRAQQFTDAWFEHVRNGRFYEAHQFTVHPQLRMPLDSSLEQLYENDEKSKEDYGKFLVKAPMDVIAAQWEGMQVHHLEHTGQISTPEQDAFVELYEVEFAPGSQPAKTRVYLAVNRSVDPATGAEGWQLRRIEPGDEVEKDATKKSPVKK
jgi:hypothetical protein